MTHRNGSTLRIVVTPVEEPLEEEDPVEEFDFICSNDSNGKIFLTCFGTLCFGFIPDLIKSKHIFSNGFFWLAMYT